MLSSLILITVVPIVLLIAAFFISRAIFRIVMAVMTIAFIILIAIGGLVIYDAYRFSDSLESAPNRFVLANGTAGVEALNHTITELDAEGLEGASNGTVFVVSDAFISLNATAGFDGVNATRDDALDAIRADDPHERFVEALSDDPALRSLYEDSLRETYDDTQMRSYVFGQLLASTLELEGNDALIIGIRDETIDVEPDRLVLRFIRVMPARVIEQTLSIEVE